MIRRGLPEIRQLHFDQNNDFLYVKKDKLTGQDTIQTITNVIKTKDLKTQVKIIFIYFFLMNLLSLYLRHQVTKR